jgi:hypothetical protein
MAAPRPWTVLPHGPLEKLEENLWAVTGALPRGPLGRRMAVVRLGDGRLVFHNGVPLAPPAMAELEAWGRPAFLVVPNRFHRLDVHAWKARYPDLRLVCPAVARPHVAKVAEVDGDLSALPADPRLQAIPLAGMKMQEAPLLVRSGPSRRATLVFGDVLFNVAHQPGAGGLLLRLVGSSGGPRVTPIGRLFAVRDRRALAADLERLAATPDLVRLLPSHGDDVTSDAPGVLRGVARDLAR